MTSRIVRTPIQDEPVQEAPHWLLAITWVILSLAGAAWTLGMGAAIYRLVRVLIGGAA